MNKTLSLVLSFTLGFAVAVKAMDWVGRDKDKIEFRTACAGLNLSKDQCIVMWHTAKR